MYLGEMYAWPRVVLVEAIQKWEVVRYCFFQLKLIFIRPKTPGFCEFELAGALEKRRNQEVEAIDIWNFIIPRSCTFPT